MNMLPFVTVFGAPTVPQFRQINWAMSRFAPGLAVLYSVRARHGVISDLGKSRIGQHRGYPGNRMNIVHIGLNIKMSEIKVFAGVKSAQQIWLRVLVHSAR